MAVSPDAMLRFSTRELSVLKSLDLRDQQLDKLSAFAEEVARMVEAMAQQQGFVTVGVSGLLLSLILSNKLIIASHLPRERIITTLKQGASEGGEFTSDRLLEAISQTSIKPTVDDVHGPVRPDVTTLSSALVSAITTLDQTSSIRGVDAQQESPGQQSLSKRIYQIEAWLAGAHLQLQVTPHSLPVTEPGVFWEKPQIDFNGSKLRRGWLDSGRRRHSESDVRGFLRAGYEAEDGVASKIIERLSVQKDSLSKEAAAVLKTLDPMLEGFLAESRERAYWVNFSSSNHVDLNVAVMSQATHDHQLLEQFGSPCATLESVQDHTAL